MAQNKRYTADELRELPTIRQGHWDNLKVESNDERVWLARTGIADGEPYDDKITVERLDNGVWVNVAEYPG